MFGALPEPPYYAVVFSSRLSGEDPAGYAAMADAMERLASAQPGFLGIETVRDAGGEGITVSYWRSERDIQGWRANAEHQTAQNLGREKWYADFRIRIARVERAYGMHRDG